MCVVTPNVLPGLWQQSQNGPALRRFIVLGDGKTAMDACIWPLQSGTPADAITWDVPRDGGSGAKGRIDTLHVLAKR